MICDFCISIIAALSNLRHSIVTGFQDSFIPFRKAHLGEFIQTLKGHSSSVCSMAWSHDWALLASVSGDKTIEIWDQAAGRCITILKGHSD